MNELKNFSPQEYLEKSIYNEKFALEIKENFPDWSLVALFYSAVHLTQAYFIEIDEFPASHSKRFKLLANILDKNTFYSYQMLYNYSQNARYYPIKYIPADVDKVYSKYFLPFKNTIYELLKSIKII
jgi:hypothetical protein